MARRVARFSRTVRSPYSAAPGHSRGQGGGAVLRQLACGLGLLMIGNAIVDFVFPRAAVDFFTTGPGRSWRFPGRGIIADVACLSPTTRRFLALWEGISGALLVMLATAGPPGGEGVRRGGPVRI